MTGHIIYEFVVFLIWHGRNYAGTRCLRTDLRRCFTTDASLVLKERVSVNSGSASRAPYRSGKSLGISSAIVIRVPITESRAAELILALRSEERRVGKESVSTCRSRWSPTHKKKK